MSATVYIIGGSWPAIDRFMCDHHDGRWSRLTLEGVLVGRAVERLASIGHPTVLALDCCEIDPEWSEIQRQLTSQGVRWMPR